MDTEEERRLRLLIRETVSETVKETFISLGIDPHDAIRTQYDMVALREVSRMLKNAEFRADMVYLRRMRKAMDQVSSVSVKTAVGIMVTSFFGMILYAIKVWIK